MPMKQKDTKLDPVKREQYHKELEECMRKYKDKKSELQWADDEFEESVIEQEMETYAKKIRSLKAILSQENNRQVA
jgi:hypothetical protein